MELWQILIHKTDLIQYLMGRIRSRDYSCDYHPLDKKDGSGNLIGVDDNAICIYKMESGASRNYDSQLDLLLVRRRQLHHIVRVQGIMRIYEDPEYCIKIYKAGQ